MSVDKIRQAGNSFSKSAASTERASKKEQLCKIYGHCPGKLKAGRSLICSVCNRRYNPL